MIERQDREHRAHELPSRASAAELVEVAAALGEQPERLGDVQSALPPPSPASW